MLTLYPPFQALLDADAAGWTKLPPPSGTAQARWRHTNGLKFTAKRHRNHQRSWGIHFTFQEADLTLEFARPHPGAMIRDLTPLWDDVARWVPTLDLVPRQTIARQVGAWLALHGTTNTVWITLNHRVRAEMVITHRTTQGILKKFRAPPALVQALDADITHFWQRKSVPDRGTQNVSCTPETTWKPQQRTFSVGLPASGHARMHLLASGRPELRDIPLPRP